MIRCIKKTGDYSAAIQFKGTQDAAHMDEINAFIFPNVFDNIAPIPGIMIAGEWKQIITGDWLVKAPNGRITIIDDEIFYNMFYNIPDAPTSEAPKEDKSSETTIDWLLERLDNCKFGAARALQSDYSPHRDYWLEYIIKEVVKAEKPTESVANPQTWQPQDIIDRLPRTLDGVPRIASAGGIDIWDSCWRYIKGELREGTVISVEPGDTDQVEFPVADRYEYYPVAECWSTQALATEEHHPEVW